MRDLVRPRRPRTRSGPRRPRTVCQSYVRKRCFGSVCKAIRWYTGMVLTYQLSLKHERYPRDTRTDLTRGHVIGITGGRIYVHMDTGIYHMVATYGGATRGPIVCHRYKQQMEFGQGYSRYECIPNRNENGHTNGTQIEGSHNIRLY